MKIRLVEEDSILFTVQQFSLHGSSWRAIENKLSNSELLRNGHEAYPLVCTPVAYRPFKKYGGAPQQYDTIVCFLSKLEGLEEATANCRGDENDRGAFEGSGSSRHAAARGCVKLSLVAVVVRLNGCTLFLSV